MKVRFQVNNYLLSKKILPFEKSPKFDYESYHKIFFLISFVNDLSIFIDDEMLVLSSMNIN